MRRKDVAPRLSGIQVRDADLVALIAGRRQVDGGMDRRLARLPVEVQRPDRALRRRGLAVDRWLPAHQSGGGQHGQRSDRQLDADQRQGPPSTAQPDEEVIHGPDADRHAEEEGLGQQQVAVFTGDQLPRVAEQQR